MESLLTSDDIMIIAMLLALILLAIVFQCGQKRTDKNPPPVSLQFIFDHQIIIKATNIMARITNLQTVTVELKPKNRKGGEAAVQAGSVVWASSDESVATIAADPENELKATITPVGLGVTQITVSADADLDEGETRQIEGSAALEVVAAEAETFEIQFDEPTEA